MELQTAGFSPGPVVFVMQISCLGASHLEVNHDRQRYACGFSATLLRKITEIRQKEST
jgi:hypothetical protein